MNSKQQIMSPHDIVILLKIISYGNVQWYQKPLAEALGISQSEVSKSLNRSKYAGLLTPNGKTVMKMALFEFLQYGLRYVFPVKPGAVVRGVPTSHSASPLKEEIQSTEAYVWRYGNGTVRGHSILPLYPSAPEAALKDPKLHEILALVDAFRVGRVRERELAIKELKKRLELGE
jgi:transcriptional regulator with XRE-family HTH domain